MRFEHVELSTSEARDANGNPRLMLAAARRLRYRPKVKADGGVVIPERERREAEIAIETAVNLMAISHGTHRSISSPTPGGGAVRRRRRLPGVARGRLLPGPAPAG